MSWSSRSYPQPIPVDPPLEIPSDLPVPSTSRVLQHRSRAASLARSAAGSRPGSRASSGSGDARTRELNEVPGPSGQETSDWYDNSQSMQSFFNSSTLFSPLPEYNMSSAEPPQMDYQNYHRSFDPDPMHWNGFDNDFNAQEGFSFNNNSSPNRRKRKRNDDDDDSNLTTPFAAEGPSQEVRDNTSSFPFQQGFQQGETSASGSSRKGIQRKKYNFKFSSNQPAQQSQYIDPMQTILTEDERNQNMMMGSSSVSSPPEYLNVDRKGKGKAKAKTPDPVPVIDISDSPPAKPVDEKSPTTKKPPNDPLSAYTCPICFSPPTNATLTPCGHICCGACLFAALKSTMQRAAMTVHGGVVEARCPVCRAVIPGWDAKGGGVIGLKARAIFRL